MNDYAPVLAHIADTWPRLVRQTPRQQGTIIGLPRPYLVPADGPMFGEMYYWDSYFMAVGLGGTEHEARILDMVENCAMLFRRFGVIPNANRYYFLSRSQPPFFTAMVRLGYELKRLRGDPDAPGYLRRMMRIAAQEHETVWLGTAQPHHRLVYRGLSRYFDANYLDVLASCESGWDHSTRCDDRWLDHLPVDLNSILYTRERDIAAAHALLGEMDTAVPWGKRARARAATMRELMWDEEAGLFCDYDYAHERRNPHLSLAAFYPLWAEIATPAQAARLVATVLPQLEQPGGLVTTLEERAGRQWAWPNGWAPLQWIAVAGLERYGYHAEAQRIMQKWCDTCAAVFAATGAMWEKYNVVSPSTLPEPGLYGTIPGFGWTNAIFSDFARRLSGAQEEK